MRHWFPALGIAVLLTACATTQPPAPQLDPSTDPTIAGAEAGAEIGLRIGRVAGVLAAVFGGPERESVDDMVDRYRMTRDAAVVTGALIGAAKGGAAGADLQFAELHKIEGLE